MAEKNSRGFVLGDDKEIVVENTAKKELHDLQFQKLGHRVTLISILIPILIAIIGYFIYADIQKKVTKVYDTGSSEVQLLSKDMDSKFSSLSVQLSKIEENFSEKVNALEQTISSTRKTIDTVSSKLRTTDANLSELKKSTTGLSGKIAPLETSLKDMEKAIGSTEEKLSAAVAEMAAEIGKSKADMEAMNSKLTTVSSSMLDQKELDKEINTLNESMERNFFSMNKKINALEAKIAQSAKSSGGLKSVSSEKTSKPKPTDEVKMIRTKPSSSKEEDFDMLEQDIEE